MGSQNIVGWIVALLVGAAAGWLLSRQRGANGGGAEKESLEARLRSFGRDLEAARAEVNSQSSTLNSLKTEVVNTSAELKSREIELGVLEERVKALEPLETEIESKKAEAIGLHAEITSLRAKLAEAAASTVAEPVPAKPAEPHAALLAELASVKQSLSAKDSEIATLLGRVKELAPLKLQITDRDLRLRDWGSKHGEAIKAIQAREEEIATLNARLGKMDAALKQAEQNQTNANGIASERDGDKAAELADRVAELADRVAELESLLKAQTDHEARIKELADQHEFMLGEKDSQLADLEARLGEADAKWQSAKAADADQHGALRDKDAAISLLQLRVKELEPLGSELAERDAKLRRLEENFLLAHAAEQISTEKDAEIAGLQARISELEASTAPTALLSSPAAPTADDRQLQELESLFQAALAEKNAELVRLRTLVGTSGSDIRARANADEAKVQELEAEHDAEISDREAEITRLNRRIQELEPLHAQLFARDARLSELEARVQGLASEKERELNRLNAQIAELAPAGERAESAEARLRELEGQHQILLNNKEVEISRLRVKVAGLENVKAQLEDRLSKLRETENSLSS